MELCRGNQLEPSLQHDSREGKYMLCLLHCIENVEKSIYNHIGVHRCGAYARQ